MKTENKDNKKKLNEKNLEKVNGGTDLLDLLTPSETEGLDISKILENLDSNVMSCNHGWRSHSGCGGNSYSCAMLDLPGGEGPGGLGDL